MIDPNDDFLIATVDLPDIKEKQSAIDQIFELQKKRPCYDKDRNIDAIPLTHRDPSTGHYFWNPAAPPIIKHWAEKHAFPWIGDRIQLLALIVSAGTEAKMHIDCGAKDIGSQQHRLRLMLQGNNSDIFYKTSQGQVNVPEISGPYLMDAGYPHSMMNTGNITAVILAFGSPWCGKDSYDPGQVKICLSKRDYGLPADTDQYVIR